MKGRKLFTANKKSMANLNLELRPLTLFYGYNDVGKSALLRASLKGVRRQGAQRLLLAAPRNPYKDYDAKDAEILASSPQRLLKVSHWCEENFQQKIIIKEVAKRPQIRSQSLINSARTNASEGLIQILPVLTAGAMASGGYLSVLGIENPDAFLHPKLHAVLAEYFFEIAKQDNPPKILIETHSENFFLRTQLEIARGKLDPELVMVYWVQRSDDGQGGLIEPVVFDSKGRPQGEWPRDVFYDDIELATSLVRERRR